MRKASGATGSAVNVHSFPDALPAPADVLMKKFF
jgi:hypothetical protein